MLRTLLILAAIFFVGAQPTLAAPIVADSLSTTWDIADGEMQNLNLGACPDSVYWEEIGNETNNGTSFTCDGFNQTSVTVTSPGEYRIDFSGSFTRVQFNQFAAKIEFRTVEQWGASQWDSFNNAFSSMTNIAINAADTPIFAVGANMTQMFRQSPAFNSDISNWDVSNVVEMDGVFDEATSFNQDLSSWDVSNVENMNSMFAGATSFNQDVSTWNVSSVINMARMFSDATSFNSNISSWNVSNVINFAPSGEGGCGSDDGMFYGATSFNQNLSTWNISNAQCLTDIFAGSGIDTENYSLTLQGWSELSVIPQDINLGSVPSLYCDTTQAARDVLIANGWMITDEGVTVCVVESNNSGGSTATRVGDRIKIFL